VPFFLLSLKLGNTLGNSYQILLSPKLTPNETTVKTRVTPDYILGGNFFIFAITLDLY